MLDLGTSFLASVARDPDALAIVDGDAAADLRGNGIAAISPLVAGFDALGLKPGDHLVTVLQNRWEAATLHWACQFAGIIITPLNWRVEGRRDRFLPRGCRGQAPSSIEDVSAASRRQSRAARSLPRIARRLGAPGRRAFRRADGARRPRDATPRVGAEAWSLMLYTSGTTARPKGVPRRQRAERAAAVAHVAQNLYAHGERTLGVMPLYHTMGVRSLLAMSLIGGAFVCLPRFDVGSGAAPDRRRAHHQSLSGADALSRSRAPSAVSPRADVSSVRKLGFAGAPMTDGLLKKLAAAFKPRSVRQPLRLVRDLHLHHRPERRRRSRAPPAGPASIR